MKKSLALFLAMLMLLSFVACNSSQNSTDDGSDFIDESTNDGYMTDSSNPNITESTENGDRNENDNPAEPSSKGLKLTLNNDGASYSVTGIGSCTETDLLIPNTYDGLPVNGIANGAFYLCTQLASVTIPANVKTIEDLAFYGCSRLTTVTMNFGVESIGERAFAKCGSITGIVIPDSIKSIGIDAFSDCTSLHYNEYDNALYLGNDINRLLVLMKAKDKTITSCEISNQAKIIYTDAFDDCYNLKSIEIPKTITNIGNGAFSRCVNLESVHISDIEAWCNIYFDNFSATPLYCGHSLYINGVLVETLQIPNTVMEISDFAFSNCKDLINVTLPDSVVSIGNSSFFGCEKLAGINIPKNVMSIGDSAFCYCSSLTSVTIPNSVTSIGSGVFDECENLQNINFENPNNIPTDFDYNAGAGGAGVSANAKLEYQIDDNGDFCTIVGIGECTDEILRIPSAIDGYAVKAIKSGAFTNCTFLSEVTIPASVETIEGVIFDGCTNLKKIIYFSSCKSALPFYVQYDYELGFKLVDTIEYGYETLHESFFYDTPRFVNLILNDNVKTVESGIFTAADGVDNLIISSTVSNIASDAFTWVKAVSIFVDQDNGAYTCENGCLIDKKTQEVLAEANETNSEKDEDDVPTATEPYIVYQTHLYEEWFEDVFVNSSSTYSNALYSSLDEDFINKIQAWELLHIASEPSHTLESGWISNKDVYKLLIFDMLGGSSNVEDLANLYDTVNNDATSYMYKFVKHLASETIIEIDDLMNCDTSAYTTDLKAVFGDIDKINDILGHFDCLYDAVYTCAQYQAFASMDEAFKNVLIAIYNDTENPEDLRNAAYECIACYEAGVQNILSQLVDSTLTNEFKSLMGDMMDEVWSKVVYSIPGGVGVFVMEGMRGIHALGDTLFNLDDRNEAFYQLRANVFLERALLNILPTIYDEFTQTLNEADAATYMRAIDMYKCVALSGYDYSIQLLKVKATAAGVTSDETAEYNNLIVEIEAYKGLKKDNFETFEKATLESYQDYCT